MIRTTNLNKDENQENRETDIEHKYRSYNNNTNEEKKVQREQNGGGEGVNGAWLDFKYSSLCKKRIFRKV